MFTLNEKDAALQRSCPVISAPLYQDLPPMEDGQRLVVAANGVFVQVKRAWLECIELVGSVDRKLPLPFGKLSSTISFAFKAIPITLLNDFITAGRESLPNEIAGGLIYCGSSGSLRLEIYEPLAQSRSKVDYKMPELTADEVIAVDLHTHGTAGAFFSPADDIDDRGVKVAGVFGNLDRGQPSAVFRLVINGMYRALPHPWENQPQPVDAVPAWPILDALPFLRSHAWNI